MRLPGRSRFTDPDIHAEYIRYPSPEGHGEVRGYLVMPDETHRKTGVGDRRA